MTGLQPTLAHLIDGRSLSEVQAESAFEIILSGEAGGSGGSGEGPIGAMLALLATRPPTVDELVGAARALRRHATPVTRPDTGPFAGARLLDTCGTGGAPKLFNISTLGAIIIAAAGTEFDGPRRAMVCKHGNVSRTGRGSAELMLALGVKIDAAPDVQTRCLAETGVCFSLASAHHPAARHAAGVRRALGFPTIFNLLGPLANPAGAERQVMGTWTHTNARLLAESLARLGSQRALVFSSRDGLDELTTTDVNVAHEVAGGRLRTFELDSAELGLARATIDALRADSLDAAVRLARDILSGAPGPCRDVALLNAAAGLWIAESAGSLAEGLDLAARAVDRGAALRTLQTLARLSHEPDA